MIMRIYELLHDDKNYYVVSEYLRGGQLFETLVRKLKEGTTMTEGDVRKIIFQLYLALNYMHEKGMMHRDIKPENILMESKNDLNIKLADFGFAAFFKESAEAKKQTLTLGSPMYMAPEILKRDEYDQKVDVWAAGVVAYVLLAGKPPFAGSTKEATFKAIRNNQLAFEGEEWAGISKEAKSFLTLALQKDPA